MYNSDVQSREKKSIQQLLHVLFFENLVIIITLVYSLRIFSSVSEIEGWKKNILVKSPLLKQYPHKAIKKLRSR